MHEGYNHSRTPAFSHFEYSEHSTGLDWLRKRQIFTQSQWAFNRTYTFLFFIKFVRLWEAKIIYNCMDTIQFRVFRDFRLHDGRLGSQTLKQQIAETFLGNMDQITRKFVVYIWRLSVALYRHIACSMSFMQKIPSLAMISQLF